MIQAIKVTDLKKRAIICDTEELMGCIFSKYLLLLRRALTLNGWPPLASHLATLFVGVALTHVTIPLHKSIEKIPQESVLMGLTVFQDSSQKEKGGLRAGDKVFLALRRLTQEGPGTAEQEWLCKIGEHSWTLVTIEPQAMIILPLKFLFTSALPAQKVRRGKFIALPPQKARELPSCEYKEPKVLYGNDGA